MRKRPSEKIDEAKRALAQWQDPRSDFITLLNLWNAIESQRGQCGQRGQGGSHGKLRRYCKLNFLNYRRVMEWTNLWRELRETAQEFRWVQPLASVPENEPKTRPAPSTCNKFLHNHWEQQLTTENRMPLGSMPMLLFSFVMN